jgi:hypothetical protein
MFTATIAAVGGDRFQFCSVLEDEVLSGCDQKRQGGDGRVQSPELSEDNL